MKKFVRLLCVIFIILTFVGCAAEEQKTINTETTQTQESEGLTVDEFLKDIEITPIPTVEPAKVQETTIIADAEEDNKSIIVYITNTGKKYHEDGCSYLKKSKIEINLEDARYSYEPCSRCNPPE